MEPPLANFKPAFTPAYGIILVSYLYLLRISEVTCLFSTGFVVTYLVITPEKRHNSHYWRVATPFVRSWLAFLLHHVSSSSSFPNGLLTNILRDLHPAVPNTTTWHSLLRCGAEALISLWVLPDQLCFWGRCGSNRGCSDLRLQTPRAIPFRSTVLFPDRDSSHTCPIGPLAQPHDPSRTNNPRGHYSTVAAVIPAASTL